ncbi:butyrate kinase [candidate division WOR-3 bacterium]|nr:butyrate kinase [candidate division WOR-3 bacterium]
MYKILVINPGGTSTKVGVYEDENPIFVEVVKHSNDELSRFETHLDQYEFRRNHIIELIEEKGVSLKSLSAVVGRGGPFLPLESGTYRINERILNDVKNGKVQAEHISNIGVFLAHGIAEKIGIPSFFVDPVSVDEFEPVARISGVKEIPRLSLSHALNMKAVARRASKQLKKNYENVNLIIVHLGSGISVSAHENGRQIDSSNANDEAPFSPQRAGMVPLIGLIELCYSGEFTMKEMMKKLLKQSGLYSHLKTDNVEEVEKRINHGDKESKLVLEAMAYQVSKWIGQMAVVLSGKIDAIVISGGIANSEFVVGYIKRKTDFLAEIIVLPGEDEMEALAMGALRVLRGEEEAKQYGGEK